MDCDAIAAEIARRDLFRRPSDGAHPPSDQIRLRARKPEYRGLFECSDIACTWIRLRPGSACAEPALRPPRSAVANEDGGADTAPATRRRMSPASTGGVSWYERLREQHRPPWLRLLLIGESPPDPGTGPRRFFYAPELPYDNLYRGVAQALYGAREDIDTTDKPETLKRMSADGLWLIDAVEQPINKRTAATRAQAIRAGVPRLVQRCRELDPELGVIVCHGKVHEAAASSLYADGVRVLHAEPLPFPLGNWRARFVEGFRRALVTTLLDELQVRLRSALGDDAGWPARPIEALDGRNVIELVLTGDQRRLERFAAR